MQTLTAVRDGEIVAPVFIQLVLAQGLHRPGGSILGGKPAEPDMVEIFAPQPRWDQSSIDEVLAARCSSL